MKYCRNCNTQYTDEINFCPKCGAKLVDYSLFLKEKEEENKRAKEAEDSRKEAEIIYQKINALVGYLGYKETYRPYYEHVIDYKYPDIVNLMYDIAIEHKDHKANDVLNLFNSEIEEVKGKFNTFNKKAKEYLNSLKGGNHSHLVQKAIDCVNSIYKAVMNGGEFSIIEFNHDYSGGEYVRYHFNVTRGILSFYKKQIKESNRDFGKDYYLGKHLLKELNNIVLGELNTVNEALTSYMQFPALSMLERITHSCVSNLGTQTGKSYED